MTQQRCVMPPSHFCHGSVKGRNLFIKHVLRNNIAATFQRRETPYYGGNNPPEASGTRFCERASVGWVGIGKVGVGHESVAGSANRENMSRFGRIFFHQPT